jgi:hypothetical protein
MARTGATIIRGHVMTTTYIGYRQIAADMPRTMARVADEPMVARETEYYRAKIGDVKSIDDLFADSRLYNYALKAHGLEDMAYAKAFIRKVLTEGVANPDSFANKLSDSRYKAFAEAFDFAAQGSATTSFTRTQQGTVDKYLRQTLEEQAGNDNTGVRLALYFERIVPTLTSMYGILADDALGQVVRTALALPPETALSDIDRQAALFEKSFAIDDFKDPAKLSKFIERFTALWELDNPSGGSVAGAFTPASLLGASSGIGISSDLLLSINTLKLGGR